MPKPFTFVGEVQTIADLPSDAEVGDVYQVIDPENDGEPNPILFAYEPTDDGNWLQINGLTDLSNYDTSKEVDDKDLALKNLLTAMIDSHTNEYALTKQVSSGKITTYGEGELGDFDLAAFHGSDNGSNYFTKTIGMSGQKITNMADGTDDTDAATVGQMKEYSVSITEAPTDGKLYGRQDSSWTEITGDFGSDSTPQMIQRSVSWTDTGVTIVYAFKGDTTSELYMCWSDMLYGTLTPVASSYIPEPSNQTMYIVSITNEYLTNTPAAGSAVSIYTTPTFDTGTRVWYETFHPQNTQIEESDPIAMAALENKSDIYYVAPESLKDIKVGDDVSNLYFIFDVAFKYADDLANPIQKVIEFSDGSYFEYEGSGTWDYIDSENKSHAIVDGGNYWTNGYIQIGDNVTITAIDPLFFDSPMSGGHLTDTSDIPSVSTPVDCEYNYNAIQAISKNLGTFVTTDYVDNSVAELESSVSDTYASKVYVDEQDGIIETDVASHKLTDRFRWSDVYLDTMLSFVRDGAVIDRIKIR